MRRLHLLLNCVLIVAILVSSVGYVWYKRDQRLKGGSTVQQGSFRLQSFASSEEMQQYIRAGQELRSADMNSVSNMFGGPTAPATGLPTLLSTPMQSEDMTKNSEGGVTTAGGGFSTTNTQVLSIDEPDILKNDGSHLYLSHDQVSWVGGAANTVAPMLLKESYPPNETEGKVRIVQAVPATDLKVSSTLTATGNLLLANRLLVVLGNAQVVGYDVSNPTTPVQKWLITLEKGTELLDARLKGEALYLITRRSTNVERPCPIQPLSSSLKGYEAIPCASIYHPEDLLSVDSLYHIAQLNVQTGEKLHESSFVGATGNLVLSMFEQNLYLTYYLPVDQLKLNTALIEQLKGQLPDSLYSRITKMLSYDLSAATKLQEMRVILNEYRQSLSEVEQKNFDDQYSKVSESYLRQHIRELESSAIVKLAVNDLRTVATGTVPGRILNQFSLDEYEGNLRIATTLGQRWWGFGGVSGMDSANDLTILDANLKSLGSVQDLGISERIYSVRFMGNRGYVVTFKQTDPFYILDLSDPRHPVRKGELKIPGYSAYLHPIAPDRILGVGRENSKVKLSLFDVHDPAQPTELDHYSLNEYWTDVEQNHHAFLQNASNQLFFLPAGEHALVMSTKDDAFTLKVSVSGVSQARGAYIGNTFYITSRQGIEAFDQTTWQKIGHLELEASPVNGSRNSTSPASPVPLPQPGVILPEVPEVPTVR